jgi:hypothetical protein
MVLPFVGLHSIWPVSVMRYDTRIMAIYITLTISSDITKTARACESSQKALWNRQIGNLIFKLFWHIYYISGWRGIYVLVIIFIILQVVIEINFFIFNIFPIRNKRGISFHIYEATIRCALYGGETVQPLLNTAFKEMKIKEKNVEADKLRINMKQLL